MSWKLWCSVKAHEENGILGVIRKGIEKKILTKYTTTNTIICHSSARQPTYVLNTFSSYTLKIIWLSRKRTEKSKRDDQQSGGTSGREERKWTVLPQFGTEMTDGRYARVFKPWLECKGWYGPIICYFSWHKIQGMPKQTPRQQLQSKQKEELIPHGIYHTLTAIQCCGRKKPPTINTFNKQFAKLITENRRSSPRVIK